ncbi:hypothetical protein HK102_009740 [Quaeritorhiza haematococci]|nr:hypothetical protein HK102_009740 [Quaeritorhiza haematococci]
MADLESPVGSNLSITLDEDSIGITDDQYVTILLVSNILNSISMFTCFLVMSTFGVGWFYNRQLLKPVTISLTLATVVVEFLYSGVQIWGNNYATDDIWCQLSVLAYISFSTLSTYLNLCIGINLQIVFVFNRRYKHMLSWFLISSIVLAFGIAIPPVFMDLYGFEESEETCWFKRPETTQSFAWKWISYHGPLCFALLYASIIAVQVWYTLYISRRDVRAASSSGALRPSRELRKDVEGQGGKLGGTKAANNGGRKGAFSTDAVLRQLASRVVFYPLIPLLGQIFNVIADLNTHINKGQNYELVLVSYIATSVQGTLAALIFFTLDPAFLKIIQTIRASHSPTARTPTKSGGTTTAPVSSANTHDQAHSALVSMDAMKAYPVSGMTSMGGAFDGGNGMKDTLCAGAGPEVQQVVVKTTDFEEEDWHQQQEQALDAPTEIVAAGWEASVMAGDDHHHQDLPVDGPADVVTNGGEGSMHEF